MFAASLVPCIHAAGLTHQDEQLVIHHRDPDGYFHATMGKQEFSVKPGETLEVELKKNRRLNLQLVDANILLFQYALGKRSELDSPNLTALLAFAEALKGLQDLPLPSSAAAAAKGAVTGRTMRGAAKNITPLGASAGNRSLINVAGALVKVGDLANDFSTIPTLLRDSVSDKAPQKFPAPGAEIDQVADFLRAAGEAALYGKQISIGGIPKYVAEDWGSAPGLLSSDDLKVSSEFHSGFYVQIGISFEF